MSATNPNLVEILAYINHLLTPGPAIESVQDKHYAEKESQFLSVLVEAMGCIHSTQQIRERLLKEFRPYFKYPEDNLRFVFISGSAAMPSLDDDTKKSIEQRRKDIQCADAWGQRKDEDLGQQPRNRPTHRSAPIRQSRRRRLPPQAPSQLSPRKRTLITIEQRINVTRKKRYAPKERAGSSSTLSSVEIDETPRQSTSPCSLIHFRAQKSKSRDESSPRLTSFRHNCSKNSRIVSASVCSEPESIPPAPPISTEVYERLSSDLEYYKELHDGMHSKVEYYKSRQNDMLHQITHYRSRCEVAEQDLLDLRKKMRQQECFLDIGAVPEKISHELNNKLDQILFLKKKVQALKELETVFAIATPNSTVTARINVRLNFNDMKKHIFSSLQIENGPHMVSKEDYRDGNQDLQVLLRTVVGTDYQSGVLTGPENPLNITLKDLLSALIGAAVHLWVFSRTFHSIDMTNTPLLQKYREAIATSCTDQSLFNLDVAVHQKLIKERDFEDLTIPRLTARHTDRFLAAVKILDSETQANEFRYSIEHIFKLAIRIRTSFLVAAETYVSFWPCRGQKINCNDMESPLMGNILENNVVRLPISPGLHVYAREKGMVEYNYPDNDKWDNATLKDTFQATILV